jgi:hypothetical protein
MHCACHCPAHCDSASRRKLGLGMAHGVSAAAAAAGGHTCSSSSSSSPRESDAVQAALGVSPQSNEEAPRDAGRAPGV